MPSLDLPGLHRCLLRHGINRLPEVDGEKPAKQKFHSHPIGYFHMDIAELRSAEGRLYLFAAIDRTSKFAFVRLAERANVQTAVDFLDALVEVQPYRHDAWPSV